MINTNVYTYIGKYVHIIQSCFTIRYKSRIKESNLGDYLCT